MDQIEREWKKFCVACFGNISDEQQYIDLRRTFYGGTAALFFLIMNLLDPGDEPTQADIDKISALRAEIFAFNESVKAGKA